MDDFHPSMNNSPLLSQEQERETTCAEVLFVEQCRENNHFFCRNAEKPKEMAASRGYGS
jgi:hypothetical protein